MYIFFYGFVQNDNYTYDAKTLNSTNILPLTPYTYNSLQQHSAQVFGNLNYDYDYFSNVNRLILQNTYRSISVASRSVALSHVATKRGHGYVWNASSNDTRYKFTSKERDAETGMDFPIIIGIGARFLIAINDFISTTNYSL